LFGWTSARWTRGRRPWTSIRCSSGSSLSGPSGEAARIVGLDEDDIRDIFFGNAADLFGIEKRPTEAGRALYDRAKSVIPGGTQLLSKRPEMQAPGTWPAYFREAGGRKSGTSTAVTFMICSEAGSAPASSGTGTRT